MAIADTINSMKTNITNAYNAIQAKGGTIPTNKNLENLSAAINSIPAGGIEEVSTVAALKAKVTAENVGKFYKYTGASSDGFESNELYQVVRDTLGVSTAPLMLGLGKVSVNSDKYTITYNYTNCGDDYPITNMPLGGIVTSNVYTTSDYVLPNSITVSGCQYTWTLNTNKTQGTLKLYNPTGNITVTIAAEMSFTPSSIIAWYNSKDITGFEPCIRTWTSTQCQIWGANFNTIDKTYTNVFDKLGKDVTQAIVDECTKLLQNDLGVIFKSMDIEWTVKSDFDYPTFTITQIMSNGTAASTGTSYIKG